MCTAKPLTVGIKQTFHTNVLNLQNSCARTLELHCLRNSQYSPTAAPTNRSGVNPMVYRGTKPKQLQRAQEKLHPLHVDTYAKGADWASQVLRKTLSLANKHVLRWVPGGNSPYTVTRTHLHGSRAMSRTAFHKTNPAPRPANLHLVTTVTFQDKS